MKRRETIYEKWKRLIKFKRMLLLCGVFTIFSLGILFEIDIHLKAFIGTIFFFNYMIIIVPILYMIWFIILLILSFKYAKSIVGDFVEE